MRRNGVEVLVYKNGTKWLENIQKHMKIYQFLQENVIQTIENISIIDMNQKTNQKNNQTECFSIKIQHYSYKFKRKLGFDLLDVTNTKEQTILGAIKKAFEGEIMQTKYHVLGDRTDLNFMIARSQQKMMILVMVIEKIKVEKKTKSDRKRT